GERADIGTVCPRASPGGVGDPDMTNAAGEGMHLDFRGQVATAKYEFLLDENDLGHIPVAPFAVPAVVTSRHPALRPPYDFHVVGCAIGDEHVAAGRMIGFHGHVACHEGHRQGA